MGIRWTKNKRVRVGLIRKDITYDTDKLIRDLKLLAKREPIDRAKTVYESLLLIAEINSLIAESLKHINGHGDDPIYFMSSLFLQDCFKFLNQREVESLHFVTGPEVGGIRVLDKIVNLRLEHQSIVYARADTEAVRNALIKLSQCKHRLLGYFHIHPGSGTRSTFPSSTDLNLKRLLDKGGYEALGAIFSRDGWIRFFSPEKLKIHIYGEGVKKINERLYHLAKIS